MIFFYFTIMLCKAKISIVLLKKKKKGFLSTNDVYNSVDLELQLEVNIALSPARGMLRLWPWIWFCAALLAERGQKQRELKCRDALRQPPPMCLSHPRAPCSSGVPLPCQPPISAQLDWQVSSHSCGFCLLFGFAFSPVKAGRSAPKQVQPASVGGVAWRGYRSTDEAPGLPSFSGRHLGAPWASLLWPRGKVAQGYALYQLSPLLLTASSSLLLPPKIIYLVSFQGKSLLQRNWN